MKYTEKIEKQEEKGEGVFDPKEFEEKGFPNTCEKCGHEYADVADLGAAWSDESDIHLFKCKKCNHVTRNAFGSSNN